MSSTSRTLKRLGVGSVGVITLLATPYLGVAPALAAVPSGPATVQIVSQGSGTGSTLSDGANTSVKISANVTVPDASNAAVAGVRFFSQVGAAAPVLIGSDTTAPYSVEWSPAAGTYNEIAEAFSAASTVISTDQVTGVVVDATSPSVHISSPAEGATIGRSPGSAGGTIVVSGTRSADLPQLAVTASTRDNSDGSLAASGTSSNVPAGTVTVPAGSNAWSSIVDVPACPVGAGAAGCDVVITATAALGSDETTQASLYSQTLTTFVVAPTSATKPVNAPQTYVVTATDQNSKPVGGLTVIVTDNSATANETSTGTDVADDAGPPVVPSSTTGATGSDGTFTFVGKDTVAETATFTVKSALNGTTYVPGTDFQRTATLTTYAPTATTPSITLVPQKSLYAASSEYTGSTP
ncbi:MAG: hypothetical protein JWM02_618, partial [Frankiales bacterium]|nr:hypothetical protein [Frankiales bacterium]